MTPSLYPSSLTKSIWYSPGWAQQAHAQTRLGSKSKVTHIAENRCLARTFMSFSFRHTPGCKRARSRVNATEEIRDIAHNTATGRAGAHASEFQICICHS